MQADITGLAEKPIVGWEHKVEAYAVPEGFEVRVAPKEWVWNYLTKEDQERLNKKLKLVEQYAAYMAAGMLKGTLKYDSDKRLPGSWLAHLLGEGADQSNYALLLVDSLGPEGLK